MHGPLKTLSPKNEALIACPIFGAEVRIAGCFALQEQVNRGKAPEERRGCQVCIRSSKCPIYWIGRRIQRTGEDLYHASEPRVVALKPEILDNVRPVIVRDDLMNQLGVSGDERDAIVAANDAASAGAKARSAPRKTVKLADVKTPAAAAPKPASDATFDAAVSGDMSAAITKAVAKAAEKPQEPAPPAPAPKPPAPAPTPPAPVQAAPKPTPKPVTPAPAGKGMSLLEMARARAAQQKEAAA